MLGAAAGGREDDSYRQTCVETLVVRLPTTMMPPMQKMAAPLPLASALCHVATVAVMMNMHIQLSTVQNTATGPHRALLDSDGDALVTVAHMTKAVDHLQDTLGSRLTAVERENSELKALVKTLAVNMTDPEHSGPAHSYGGTLDEDMAPAPYDISRETVAPDAMKGHTIHVHARTTVHRWANPTLHRRTQAMPQACARMTDFQALSAAAMDACCPPSGGGHRRMQASCDLPATCPSAACAAVFVPFMDDCATMLATMPGVPVADFQSFAASCSEMHQQEGPGELLQPVAVQMFRVLVNTEGAAQASSMFSGGVDGQNPLDVWHPLPPVPPSSPDAPEGGDETRGATQYHRVCTSTDVASCVPPCNAEHHGYELLATIDGTDTKFCCNLAHDLYSWTGASSEGGYLGSDSASFFSAVTSGAAGCYILTLVADAGIRTDIVIELGQDVHLNGLLSLAEAPAWGSGGFAVQQLAALQLEYVEVDGRVIVESGATRLAMMHCVIGDGVFGTGLLVPNGTTVTIADSINAVSFGWVSVQFSARLVVRGGALADNRLVGIAVTPSLNLGSIAFDRVTTTAGDGTSPILVGVLPGVVTATIDSEVVGTVSVGEGGQVAKTGSWWVHDFWNSGVYRDGPATVNVDYPGDRPFVLASVLVEHDEYDGIPDCTGCVDGMPTHEQYTQACMAVGMRTVGPPVGIVPPALGCKPSNDELCTGASLATHSQLSQRSILPVELPPAMRNGEYPDLRWLVNTLGWDHPDHLVSHMGPSRGSVQVINSYGSAGRNRDSHHDPGQDGKDLMYAICGIEL
eukprot:COSAG02_NODE_4380_length_5425_cov_171.848104_2_plen_803_part_00